jgi:hypothetical protein
MDPITIAMLATTALSAFGQLSSGQAAKKAAELDAFNIETDRELGKAQAIQNASTRLEVYKSNMSTNTASFAASGRDVGADRSVSAFNQRQKEIVGKDLKSNATMGLIEANKATAQAGAVRTEGRAAKQSATIGALTSIASGAFQYYDVKTTRTSSLAPTTSLRPKMRPL